MLQPDKLKKLNENAIKMSEQGSSKDDILAMKNAFIAQFSTSEPLDTTSTSTIQKENLVLEQKSGSSDLPKMKSFDELSKKDIASLKSNPNAPKLNIPKPIERTLTGTNAYLKKLSNNKPKILENYTKLTNSEVVDQAYIDQERQDIEADFNDTGFLNTVTTGLKNVANAIIAPTQAALTFGTSDPEPFFQTDPFSKEKLTVEKRITLEISEAKKLNLPKPIYNQEAINKMVKEEKLSNNIALKKESQVRSFIEDLDESDKDDLSNYKLIDALSLDLKEKDNLKKQGVISETISVTQSEILGLVSKSKKGNLTEDDKVNLQNYSASVKQNQTELLKLKEDFYSNDKKLGTTKENLDLLKRDYTFSRHFKNLEASIIDLFSNTSGVLDYGFKAGQTVVDNFDMPVLSGAMKLGQQVFGGSSIELKKDSENLRSKTARPISVDGIKSWDDLGSWAGDTFTSQATIFALIATGLPGVATLGATSTGQKYQEMKAEMEAGTEIYDNSQLLSIPAIFGASEIASATVDLYLFKQAQRTYRAATSGERSMIADGFGKKLFNLVKAPLIEVPDEISTQFVQNAADIYLGGKTDKDLTDGFKDAGAAAVLFGLVISTAPAIISKATNKYSTDTKLQKVNAEMIGLQAELDKSDISDANRKTITDQLNVAKEKSTSLLKKRVKDMSTLSNEQFLEINTIEKTQANIRDKAKSIKEDTSLNNDTKKQILGNLKEEFNATEQRRVDLLNRGANVQLERIDEKDRTRLKEKALKELTKEQNPDGTKEITIKDDEISKRAVQIYNQEVQVKNAKIKEAILKEEALKKEESEKIVPVQDVVSQPIELSVESNAVKEVVTPAQQVEGLRADEQAELREAIPNAEQFVTDGKIDETKLENTEDKAKFNEIYDKYDKLITPLLEQQNEATPSKDTPANGNVRPRIDGLEQTPQQPTNTPSNVSETVDVGKGEGDVEVVKKPTNKVKRIKSLKDAEYDVTFDEDGFVVKINSVKDGREISQFSERLNKKTNKKFLVKNANYSRIEADALGVDTKNKTKVDIDKFISEFDPNSEYEHALKAIASGSTVSKESYKKEVSNENNTWATSKEGLSVEMLADSIWQNNSNLDIQDLRNEIIGILGSNGSLAEVKELLASTYRENQQRLEDQELFVYLNGLTEKELAIYESVKAEDDYLNELTQEEKQKYYETEYRKTIENDGQSESEDKSIPEGNEAKEPTNAEKRIKLNNAKIDDVVEALKGFDKIFGIKIKADDIDGLNKNGIDIVTIISDIVKKAMEAGVNIDEAIRKTIEHLEKTLDFKVDATTIKANIKSNGLAVLENLSKSNITLKNKNIRGKLLSKTEAKSLQKEIESKYLKPGDNIFEGDDIRQKLFNYDNPVAQKMVNGIDVRVTSGLRRGRESTYLIYADGKIAGEFFSVKDAKSVVDFIEKNLVKEVTQGESNVVKRIKLSNAKIDDVVKSLKGIDTILGVKIKVQDSSDLNKNGIDIVNVIASIVKQAVAAGINIDEAIKKTIAHLKETIDFDVNIDDIKEKLNPKKENINISDAEKEFIKNSTFVPNSGEVGNYLSGETIEKYSKEAPENNQEYQKIKLREALIHGLNNIELAKQAFGDNFVAKVLEFAEKNELPIDAKSLLYVSLENELERQKLEFPNNRNDIQKKLNLVREKSQAFARLNSIALNLRRLQAFQKANFDVNNITEKIFSDGQRSDRAKIEKAVEATPDEINDEYIKQEEGIDDFEKELLKYTQEDFENELRKQIKKVENQYNEKRNEKLRQSGKNLADKIRALKVGKTVIKSDYSLGAFDLAMEAIAKLVEGSVELGIAGISLAEAISKVVGSGKFKGVNEEQLTNDILGGLDKKSGNRAMSDETKRKIYIKLLNKNIDALDAQIAQSERKVVSKEDKYKNDVEINNLREIKKTKQEQLSKIDPSYANRRKLKTNLNLAQKSLDEYQRRIDENDFLPKEKESIDIDAKLKELRDKRNEKRKEYQESKKEYSRGLKEDIKISEEEQYQKDIASKVEQLKKQLEKLIKNEPKNDIGKKSLWSKEISDLKNEIKDLANPKEKLTQEEQYQKKVDAKIQEVKKKIADLIANKPINSDGKNSVWSKELSNAKNELNNLRESKKEKLTESEKQVQELQRKIDQTNQQITDLENNKPADSNIGKSSVWSKELSEAKERLKSLREKIKQNSPKELVKQSLIEAGYSRTVNVKGEEKTHLDWKKLAGEEGSIENIKKAVEKVLKDKGYSESKIASMSSLLEKEYTDLRASIIEKSMREIDNRNKTRASTSRKKESKRLAELYNYGMFDQNIEDYEKLLNSALGFSDFEQKTFDELRVYAKALAEIYSTNSAVGNNVKISELAIKTQVSQINKKIEEAVSRNASRLGGKVFNAVSIIKDYAGLSQLSKLMSAKQLVENPMSGFIERKLQGVGDMFSVKEDGKLVADRKKLANYIYVDIVRNGGLFYGEVSSTLVSQTKVEDWLNNQSDNKIYHTVVSALTGRSYLSGADSFNKALITEKMFSQNLVKILSSASNPNGRMSEDKAMQFVAERITGQNFEEAKITAKEIIDKVNLSAGKEVLKSNDAVIYRFANDIVKESLLIGKKISIEEIESAYDAAYRSAGFSIGHEANNAISKMVSGENSRLEKALEKSIREKKWSQAVNYSLATILMKNIVNPFVGGGSNWMVLTYNKAGIPLSTYFDYNLKKDNPIDLSSKEGIKNLTNALVRDTNFRNTASRNLIGATISISMVLALKASGGDDDLDKWLKKNEWSRRYFNIIAPPAVVAMIAAENKELGRYLMKALNVKVDNFDNTVKVLKSIDAENTSTLGITGQISGSIFDTPLPWRMIKDIDNLKRGLNGLPESKPSYEAKGFVNGYFLGGAIDYVELRPGEDYVMNKQIREVKDAKSESKLKLDLLAKDVINGSVSDIEYEKRLKELVGNDYDILTEKINYINKKGYEQYVRKSVDPYYIKIKNEPNPEIRAIMVYRKLYNEGNPLTQEQILEIERNMNIIKIPNSDDYNRKMIELKLNKKE
jgi:hypothetical protein